MKDKFKKIIIGIVVICSICYVFNFAINSLTVKADSGWDSSYDSGGSSWGSGSSWDYDSSWSSSSGSGSGSSLFSEDMFIALAFLIIITFFIYVFKYAYEANGENGFGNHDYHEIDDATIIEVDSDLVPEEFKLEAFQIYKDIQTAWMNFDTKTIRKLTTDELYNMYSSQLEALKLKNQKNMMEDITLEDVRIIGIEKENDVITVQVYLWVKCFDYVINEKTGKTVRGRKTKKLNIEYEISLVKSATKNNKKEKCSNCGAEIEMNASAVCPYCRSTLVKTSEKYVMSKKTCVGQSLEK